jgi:hypothetical protein
VIWTRHVAHIREMSNEYKILVEKPKRRRLFQRFGVGGWVILKLIFKK